MKRMKNRLLALLMTGILTISMTGCGNDKTITTTDVTKGSDEGEFVYVPEVVELPSDPQTYSWDICGTQDKLYYTVYNAGSEGNDANEIIYSLDINADNSSPQVFKEKTVKPDESGFEEHTLKSIWTNDGEVISAIQKTLAVVEGSDQAPDPSQNSFFLDKTDKEGNQIFRVDITSYINMDQANSVVMYAAEDKEGQIILSNGSTYFWVFDKDGNHITDIQTGGSYIVSFGVTKEGIAAYVESNTNGMFLHAYDASKKNFDTIYSNLPYDCWNTKVNPGISEGILISGQKKLYEYSTSTQKCTDVLNWMDMDIQSDMVQNIFAMENGDIAVFCYDWESNQKKLVLLRKTPASEVKVKEVITLSCMGLSPDMQNAIVEFNKSSDQYRIVIKDYAADIDWSQTSVVELYKEALQQFQLDIVTGNGADLFVSADLDVKSLVAKGVIEDLNPYLENSKVIQRSELIEPVLDAYTEDGILCAIPDCFSIYTMMGRASDLGEKNGWTVDDFIAFAEQHPDNVLHWNACNNVLLSELAIQNLSSFVDWEKGECYFNTDEFKKILNFTKKYPSLDKIDNKISEPESITQQGARLSILSLYAPYLYQLIEYMFGEPITSVGYPVQNGTGVFINSSGGLCINTASKNKEVAWIFIEFLLDKQKEYFTESDCISYSMGFPIIKSCYDKLIENAMRAEYLTDENGNTVLSEEGTPQEVAKDIIYYTQTDYFEVYALTQEEADAIWQIICNIDGQMTYSSKITEILYEEAGPFYQDQKTADEVADIIQGRVQVLINESK